MNIVRIFANQIIERTIYHSDNFRQFVKQYGIPTNINEYTINSFHNIQRGNICVIIGNGPSLSPIDLDLLNSKKVTCLASNKIFKIFDRTNWRPDYYAIEDAGVAVAEKEEINRMIKCPIIAASYLKSVLKNSNNTCYFRLLERVNPPDLPDFSLNILNGINCGGTITYTLIQLASYMGFKEIYLLGVDFNYSLPNLKPSDVYSGLNTYQPNNEANYFSKDYIKPGEVVVAPDLESSLCAYRKAQLLVQAGTIPPIFNATRGGKLEVFPRVDFDSLF